MSNPLIPDESRAHAAVIVADHRRWIALLEVFLCSGIPTGGGISILLQAIGVPSETASGAPYLPFILTLLLADTILVIGLMIVLLRAHGESPTRLWMGDRPIFREGLFGVALVPLVFLMVIVLLNSLRLVAPGLHNVPTNPFEEMASNSTTDAAMFGVTVILAGGVREELQRAFLLNRFEQHLGGAAVGVVVLSTGFGLGHVLQGWDAVITTGTLGAFWAIVYLRRRSSVAPVVCHAGFNSLEVLRVAMMGAS